MYPEKWQKCVFWFIQTKLDVPTKPNYRNTEKIHQQVVQFVYDTKNHGDRDRGCHL